MFREVSLPPHVSVHTVFFSQDTSFYRLITIGLSMFGPYFEYKYIWRDRNVSSVAGKIERAARIISII